MKVYLGRDGGSKTIASVLPWRSELIELNVFIIDIFCDCLIGSIDKDSFWVVSLLLLDSSFFWEISFILAFLGFFSFCWTIFSISWSSPNNLLYSIRYSSYYLKLTDNNMIKQLKNSWLVLLIYFGKFHS
jgi:hypothetical protein